MITLSYHQDLKSKMWIVYGTKIINNNPITRQFEIFRTEKGAINYINKYTQKQTAFYSKKGK